jgi:hypothetical protein
MLHATVVKNGKAINREQARRPANFQQPFIKLSGERLEDLRL